MTLIGYISGREKIANLPVALILAILLGLSACAQVKPPQPPDFSKFEDQPLPLEAIQWLNPGPQTKINDLILQVSNSIKGQNRRERLYQVQFYIWDTFRYDVWLNDIMLQRTAAQLFEEKTLGGCSDFALAKVALFRAVGIPARLVLTANTDWLKKYRLNPLTITTGHVFIEAYLEDRWLLVDSTYRKLFAGYDLTDENYPRGELFCLRGADYWSLNLRNVEQLNSTYAQLAVAMAPEKYRAPKYEEYQL